MFVLSRFGIACLAFLLCAPAMQTHFELSFMVVYYVPIGAFAAVVVLMNVAKPDGFFDRFKQSLVLLLLFAAGLFAFMVGDLQDMETLNVLGMNCLMGVLAILYPWDETDLRWFLAALAGSAAVIALNTILNLSNDAALALVSEDLRGGYLRASMAMAFGCIAALYLVVDRFTLMRIALFGVCWYGLALGRGRGAFLFCVLVSLVYLGTIMFNRVASFKSGKKIFFTLMIAVATPFVITALLSFGLTEAKWGRLVFDFGAEVTEGGRGSLMTDAFARFASSPVFGNGLGAAMENDGHPHNLFLQFAVDGGLVSLLLLTTFLYFVMQRGYRAYANADPHLVNLTVAASLIFVFVLMNLLKSGDAYASRDMYILAMLPIACRRLAEGKLLIRRRLSYEYNQRAMRRADRAAVKRAVFQAEIRAFGTSVDYAGYEPAAKPPPEWFHEPDTSTNRDVDIPDLLRQPDVALDLEPEDTLFQRPDMHLEQTRLLSAVPRDGDVDQQPTTRAGQAADDQADASSRSGDVQPDDAAAEHPGQAGRRQPFRPRVVRSRSRSNKSASRQ